MIVAALVTPFVPGDLVDALRTGWLAQMGGLAAHESLAVVAAQIALETSNGRSCIRWNVGNYKALAGLDECQFETVEWVLGKPIHVLAAFACFDSLQAGCEHQIRDLYTRWPKAWDGVVNGDPEAFARGLGTQQPPYYTAPVDQYAHGVCSWFSYYMAKLGGDPAPTEPEIGISWASPVT